MNQLVTRIAAGIEAMRRIQRGIYEQELWWIVEKNYGAGVSTYRATSQLLANNSFITQVFIHVLPNTEDKVTVLYLKVFLINAKEPTLEEVAVAQPIIHFGEDTPSGSLVIYTSPFKEWYELARKVAGSDRRLGVEIRATLEGSTNIKVGIAYREP
jgi:hypothetical protein